jgi:hypothetical protein
MNNRGNKYSSNIQGNSNAKITQMMLTYLANILDKEDKDWR